MNKAINYGWQAMRNWLQQPLGQHYIGLTKNRMSQLLVQSFGYHLLIIGEPELANCLVKSCISHHILVHHCEASQRNIYSLCCARQDKLPLGSDSVDLVYLAHSLEIYPNAEEILHEAYRVLRPDGKLIISGFNPVSLWGLGCAIGRLCRISAWRSKFVSLHQLKYKLMLMGFSHLHAEKFFYCLPINQPTALKRMDLLERLACKFKLPFGAAYLIMAAKRVITLTPIKPAWHSKRSFLTDDLIETAAQK